MEFHGITRGSRRRLRIETENGARREALRNARQVRTPTNCQGSDDRRSQERCFDGRVRPRRKHGRRRGRGCHARERRGDGRHIENVHACARLADAAPAAIACMCRVHGGRRVSHAMRVHRGGHCVSGAMRIMGRRMRRGRMRGASGERRHRHGRHRRIRQRQRERQHPDQQARDARASDASQIEREAGTKKAHGLHGTHRPACAQSDRTAGGVSGRVARTRTPFRIPDLRSR